MDDNLTKAIDAVEKMVDRLRNDHDNSREAFETKPNYQTYSSIYDRTAVALHDMTENIQVLCNNMINSVDSSINAVHNIERAIDQISLNYTNNFERNERKFVGERALPIAQREVLNVKLPRSMPSFPKLLTVDLNIFKYDKIGYGCKSGTGAAVANKMVARVNKVTLDQTAAFDFSPFTYETSDYMFFERCLSAYWKNLFSSSHGGNNDEPQYNVGATTTNFTATEGLYSPINNVRQASGAPPAAAGRYMQSRMIRGKDRRLQQNSSLSTSPPPPRPMPSSSAVVGKSDTTYSESMDYDEYNYNDEMDGITDYASVHTADLPHKGRGVLNSTDGRNGLDEDQLEDIYDDIDESLTSPMQPAPSHKQQNQSQKKRKDENIYDDVTESGGSAYQELDSVGGVAVKVLYTAVALYNYEATQEDELTIKKGQRVEVLEESSDSWVVARLNGQVGSVPGNYLNRM